MVDCDSSQFTPYDRNGVAKLVKQKVTVEFSPLTQVLECREADFFDQDLQYLDFCKIENFKWASILFKIKGDNLAKSSLFKAAIEAEAKKIEDYEEKLRFK